MLRSILLIVLLGLPFFGRSQDNRIEIIQPKELDSILHNKTNCHTIVIGFRVQFFSHSEKMVINALRTEFKQQFPEHNTYDIFNFKTREYALSFGDYWNESEAAEAMKMVITRYPDAVIIKSQIFLPEQ